MQNSEKIWQLVDSRKDDYEALSDRVWGMPELAYTEYRSMAEHRAIRRSRFSAICLPKYWDCGV